MTACFTTNGYRISNADPCLFISDKGSLAFAWVDDLILVGTDTNEMLKQISNQFKIKDLGIAQNILGMKIDYFEDGSMFLNQRHYIKDLPTKYSLEDCKSSRKTFPVSRKPKQ